MRKMKWIDCKDRLPENPTSPLDSKNYLVALSNEGNCYYNVISYAGGWNCMLCFDGSVDKTYEIKNAIAWMEIPKYDPEEKSR